MRNVLTVILAGGRGTRLEPLTRDRAKPAVPFGGLYRIIDFPLSNCINSGLRKVLVLTQYKAASLDRHIHTGWHFLSRDLGEYIDIVPPQQRVDDHWYLGTANAIYQNIYSIEKESPTHVLVLSGDHIYKMNYQSMIDAHIERNADATIATLPVELSQARDFGIVEVDEDGQVIGFQEKPEHPKPMPDNSNFALASMGIYIFTTDVLCDQLCEDAVRRESNHDFGRDVLPDMINNCRVLAFPFQDENRKSSAYWRDVGTLDSYYAANLDLVQVDPVLNLYDTNWPIRTNHFQDPPAKFVFSEPGDGPSVRRGEAFDSIVCAGCIVSGGHVRRSILSRKVRINSYALVEDSILFENVNVGRHARIRRAIIDKDVVIPPGDSIGYDVHRDRERGFTVTDGGVVVIAKASNVGSAARRRATAVAT
jgi:glucose-1-phosphate adenylyltransferase